MGMVGFFPTGSIGNGTGLSGADVDYFAVIPPDNRKRDSERSLEDVASALRQRFPQTTGIRISRPRVYVPFGADTFEPTEVIPVACTGKTLLGFRSFLISDDSGGWKFSAPESHEAYVAEVDAAHLGHLKPLTLFTVAGGLWGERALGGR